MSTELAITLIVGVPAFIWAVYYLATFRSKDRNLYCYAVQYVRKNGSINMAWNIYATNPNEAMKIVEESLHAEEILEVSLKMPNPDYPKHTTYRVIWTAPRQVDGR